MIFILSLFFLASSALATEFNNCASGPPPVELRLAGCSSLPCTFSPGGSIDAEVDFTVDHTISALTPNVKATVLGLDINYPIPADGCKALKDASCPLQDGEVDTWTLHMTIPDISVESPVALEITLADQDSNIVACFDLNGNVVINS